MPEMNGLDLVREVQREFPLVPVILMTAQGSETIAVEALQQGAASYVPKSKLASMLAPTVQQVLSLAGERRSKRALLRYMQVMECHFELDNDTSMLTSLVSYLQGILRDMDVLSENDRLRTGVALEEALLNAAYHGNLEVSSELREVDHMQFYDLARQRCAAAPYMHRRIHIDVRIDAGGLQYVVRDEGPGFDPSGLPDPTDPANLERPCGRGLLLMKTFMDEVSYNDRGNEVTMRKRCRAASLI
jgi:anti-sigma regulatory factor (Ser/Thr protein kinase)